MKNRNIEHSRRQVKIYEEHYKPSFNLARFARSIFGILLFGHTTVAHSYAPQKRKVFK